jgi:hypothetical protein
VHLFDFRGPQEPQHATFVLHHNTPLLFFENKDYLEEKRNEMKTKTQKLIFQTLLLSICSVALYAFPAFAQSSDDYNKVEFYGGYSRASVQSGDESFTAFGMTFGQCSSAATPILGKNFQSSFCRRRGFNGFDASITYNFTRYFGIKANADGHFKTESFTDAFPSGSETVTTKDRIHNFLIGVQLKDNSKTKSFKPFAHALVGASRFTATGVRSAPAFPPDNYAFKARVKSFAMKFGGGLDLRLNRRFDLRLVEFDYNPIFTRDFPITGLPFGSIAQHSRTVNNFTVGFGLAFH